MVYNSSGWKTRFSNYISVHMLKRELREITLSYISEIQNRNDPYFLISVPLFFSLARQKNPTSLENNFLK